MISNIIDIIMCVLLVVAGFSTIVIVGVFWYFVFATIFDKSIPQKPTDKEINDKTE